MAYSAILIDDEPDVLDGFQITLEIKGIQILGTSTSGKNAVALYEKHNPDVVISDVQMPGYDGFYVLEKIREFDPDANVIMLTADLREATEKRLLELNASGVIYKPPKIEDLVDMINGVIEGTYELSMPVG